MYWILTECEGFGFARDEGRIGISGFKECRGDFEAVWLAAASPLLHEDAVTAAADAEPRAIALRLAMTDHG